MKTIYAALLPLAVLVHGCTSEITDKCPPVANLILNFSYTDDNGNEIFSRSIESVYVYLFDENMYLAGSKYVSGAELDRTQGVEWVLDEGEYNVVCWGNIEQEDAGNAVHWSSLSLSGFQTRGENLFYAPEREIVTRSGDGYKPFTVNIPKRGKTETTINFMTASRSMDIYVRGFEDSGGSGNLAPKIGVSSVPEGYDFFMETISKTANYSMLSRYVTLNNTPVAEAGFKAPYFPITEDIEVTVYKQSDGKAVHTVVLREFLDSQGIDPGIDGDISILIEFRNGQAILSLPDWDTTDVEPEL